MKKIDKNTYKETKTFQKEVIHRIPVLRKRKRELEQQIKPLQDELDDINRVLNTIKQK